MLAKSNNVKLKRKLDGQTNLYSCCIWCSVKTFATIDKEKISDLLKWV